MLVSTQIQPDPGMPDDRTWALCVAQLHGRANSTMLASSSNMLICRFAEPKATQIEVARRSLQPDRPPPEGAGLRSSHPILTRHLLDTFLTRLLVRNTTRPIPASHQINPLARLPTGAAPTCKRFHSAMASGPRICTPQGACTARRTAVRSAGTDGCVRVRHAGQGS